MKSLEEFQAFYASGLKAKLDELEIDRKAKLSKVYKNIFSYLLFVVAIVSIGLLINKEVYDGSYLDGEKDNVPFTISLIVSFLAIFVPLGMNRKIISEYTAVFKEKIIRSIVKFIHQDLNYFPERYIDFYDFDKSQIFQRHADKYFGDDYVEGTIDKTRVAFSEIHAKYKTQSNDDDNADKWVNLFDGLFFKADFNKDFKGKYFVLPDFAEKSFGGLGKFFQKLNKTRGQLISLEDVEFEKAFAVYGSDQVEARYILSASFMKRLLDFKKQTKRSIMISFVNSSMYIAIPYKRNLFEPKFFSSADDIEKTTQYFVDLQLAISIVDELNLNTRIWSKGETN